MRFRHHEEHPIRNEEEYFARENVELIKEMRARLDDERLEQERRKHFMKCPQCGADLAERQLEDVKVDLCPVCHGVWLRHGELDLIRHINKSIGPVGRIMSDILGLFQHPRTGETSAPPR
jgi:uncharacterized protein